MRRDEVRGAAVRVTQRLALPFPFVCAFMLCTASAVKEPAPLWRQKE